MISAPGIDHQAHPEVIVWTHLQSDRHLAFGFFSAEAFGVLTIRFACLKSGFCKAVGLALWLCRGPCRLKILVLSLWDFSEWPLIAWGFGSGLEKGGRVSVRLLLHVTLASCTANPEPGLCNLKVKGNCRWGV